MIDNKLVTIKKENVFDKGWALFTPCRDVTLKNNKYSFIRVDDVVRKITYAQTVILFLSETCLSRKIIEELKWVNSYAKIYLVAKTENILNFYNDIRFASAKVDDSITINYIGINSKDEKSHYFIADGFQKTDDAIEKIYASSKEANIDLSVFENAEKIVILGNNYLSYYDQVFHYCQKNKISLYFAKQVACFDKADYDKYANVAVELIVADYVGEGICIEKQGRLFHASLVKGQFILVEVEDFSAYISNNVYKNIKSRAVLTGNEIPSDMYVLFEKKLELLEQAECHIIAKEIQISTMADFIEERFDNSEVAEHNQFSAIAKNVEYRFTLIPPLYSNQFVHSVLYSQAKELLNNWAECYSIPIGIIREEISLFQGKESFDKMLQHIEDSDESVRYIINEYQYKEYRSILGVCKKNLSEDVSNIIKYCLEINTTISNEISGSQNSKIDDEIAGYERTIREKEALIQQNIDVLQSKRRIEILRRKIEDLIKIKGQFSSKQSTNIATAQDDFALWCSKLLNGNLSKIEEDSVSLIVNNKETSKKEQLKHFLQRWLKQIKTVLENLIKILSLMEEIDVPEDYVVYDCKKNHYIVIEKEEEYHKTMEIQKKYNLQCVTRR